MMSAKFLLEGDGLLAMRIQYKAGLLIFIVLMAYLPSLGAGASPLDDWALFAKMEKITSLGVGSLFSPDSEKFYRPLLMLTFFLDFLLWGGHGGIMHLENILIHAANSTLVFLVARQAIERGSPLRDGCALVAALLFAIHPVNVEAVSWISGRSDSLATMFVLIAVVMLLSGLRQNKLSYVYFSALSLFSGALTKEVSVFFFPCALLFIFLYTSDGGKLKQRLRWIVPYFVSGAAYGIFRIVLMSNDRSLEKASTFNGSIVEILGGIFKTIGFYTKKIFIPVPLNLAITDAGDYYLLPGIVVFIFLGFCLFKASRGNVASLFFVSGVVVLFSAVVVALTNVAWTPYAERYLYLPLAFFCISIAPPFAHLQVTESRIFLISVSVLLMAGASLTIHRNLLWQEDGLVLLKDTVEKAPKLAKARYLLALGLLGEEKNDEAEEHIRIGLSIDPSESLLCKALVELKLNQNSVEEARQVLSSKCAEKESLKRELLDIFESRNVAIDQTNGL